MWSFLRGEKIIIGIIYGIKCVHYGCDIYIFKKILRYIQEISVKRYKGMKIYVIS